MSAPQDAWARAQRWQAQGDAVREKETTRANTAEAECARLRRMTDAERSHNQRAANEYRLRFGHEAKCSGPDECGCMVAEIERGCMAEVVREIERLRESRGEATAAAQVARLQAKRDRLDVADALELQTIATHEQVVSAAKILSSALRDALTMLERQTRLLEGRHTPADAVNLLVMGLLGWAADAPNSAESRGSYLGRHWVLTVQWVDGKTPGELIAEAQAERDAALGDRDEWRAAAIDDRNTHRTAIESYAEALRHGKIALLDLARPTTVTAPNDPAKDPE